MTKAEDLKSALERQMRLNEDIKKLLVNKRRLLDALEQELGRQKGADISIERSLEQQQIQNQELQSDYELIVNGNAQKSDANRIVDDLKHAETARSRTAAQLREELSALRDMQGRLEAAADILKRVNADTRSAIGQHAETDAAIESSPRFSSLALVTAIASVMLSICLYKVWEEKSVGLAFDSILTTSATPTSSIVFFLCAVVIIATLVTLLWVRAHRKKK